jgi:Flp pilus assembly protein TadD
MGRGKVRLYAKDYANAAEDFARVATIAPDLKLGYYYGAQAELGAGNYSKAQELVEKVLALEAENAQAFELRGDILLAAGDKGEAFRSYLTAQKLDSEHAEKYTAKLKKAK